MDRLSALPSELLEIICQFVQLYGPEHIASLRSCNHCLTDAASQYLFSVLVIGTRKRLLRRIRWVAARPEFARGVREIEYDTTKYTGRASGRAAWCRYLKDADPWIPNMHYWLNILSDQMPLLRTEEVLDTLVSTLPYFPHVRSATLSNRDVLHRSHPFPSYGVVGFSTVAEHQIHGYLCLVRAFAQSSHRLKEFSVFPQSFNDGQMLSGMLQLRLPGVLSATQATFEHLTVVRLRSTVDCPNFQEQDVDLDQVLEIGLIAQVLGYATRLRQVSLTFRCETYHRKELPFLSVIGKHTWGSLAQIELDGVDIRHAKELCDFLNRHSNTITTITLRNINLMDGQWVTVADCLRGLPELRGLLLEGLEVESCEHLYCFAIMEITDRAMGGRHNNLISDRDTLLGALNFY